MKILLALLTFYIFVPLVHADYNQAYSDYQFNYSQYRKSYQDFTVSKSTFLTYKTLTTQNEAIEKMRKVLTDRSNIVSAYLNLVQEKMAQGEGISISELSTFKKIVLAQDSWLNGHQKQIAAAATLEDLNDISANFDTRYPQILNETKKAIGTILISKNDFAYSKMPDFFTRTEMILNRLPGVGEDNLSGLRGLSVAKSKAQLWETKRTETMSLLTPKQYSYNESVDLFKAQQLLLNGLQYLKESSNFLKEIANALI